MQEPKENDDTYPYWMGLTAGNILAPLFDWMDDLLSKLSSLSIEVNRDLFDAVEGILKSIYKEIEDLIAIIDLINEVLDYINSLLNIPTLGILSFDVKGGAYEAAEYIRNATGFFENAVDDAKDIKKLATDFQKQLDVQENKYSYYNKYKIDSSTKKMGATDYTNKYLVENITLWSNRYNVLKSIYNYLIQGQVANKLEIISNYNKKISEYNRTLEIQNGIKTLLLNTGATSAQIASINSKLQVQNQL